MLHLIHNHYAGMWLKGDTNVTVGESANISCFSDFDVQRLEWIYRDEVVASSGSQQVHLVFDLVQEYFHNREYTCKAVTTYGTMEQKITIHVHSKLYPWLASD